MERLLELSLPLLWSPECVLVRVPLGYYSISISILRVLKRHCVLFNIVNIKILGLNLFPKTGECPLKFKVVIACAINCLSIHFCVSTRTETGLLQVKDLH